MLQSLNIVNFAIIEDSVIDFDQGITVFTGETGAGKSIIFDALSVLLGRRASVGMIRHGAVHFRVEGVFAIDDDTVRWMNEKGLETNGNELIITRKMTVKGRGTCMINGSFATVKQLEELGERLVILHEQNDNFSLLSSDSCCRIVDNSCKELKEAHESYINGYKDWNEIRKKLEDFKENKQEHERRLDILEWEIKRIRETEFAEGEDEEISERLKVLENMEKIHDHLASSQNLLTNEQGIQDMLSETVKNLESIAGYDKRLSSISESLSSASYLIDDAISAIDSYESEAEYSEDELNSLQERDEVLNELKRKYGPTLSDVKEYLEKDEKEYAALHDMVFENEDMVKEFQEKTRILTAEMRKLNGLRDKYGKVFSSRMEQVLRNMGMPNARVSLHLVPSDRPAALGYKEMEFYFSANAGEPLASMRKVASGGEISRIALALEVITAPLFKAQTLVFDEIDVGISGKAALAVASEISRLGKTVQILCITHLAQTASIGNRYYHIEKETKNGNTSSNAVLLSHEDHLKDVAQLISGNSDSEAALESAMELEKILKK